MIKNNKKFVDPLIKRKKNISSKVQYYDNIRCSGSFNGKKSLFCME